MAVLKNRGKFRWVINAFITSIILLPVYMFPIQILVAKLYPDYFFLSFGGGFYSEFGFKYITLYLYFFFLVFSLCLFAIFRFGTTASRTKMAVFCLIFSIATSFASYGVVIQPLGGPSEYYIYFGLPYWFYNKDIMRLPLHIYAVNTFYFSHMLIDFLFWFILFLLIWRFVKFGSYHKKRSSAESDIVQA